jgi:hypothetical protein
MYGLKLEKIILDKTLCEVDNSKSNGFEFLMAYDLHLKQLYIGCTSGKIKRCNLFVKY